jgi:hypothetical protein
MGQVYGVSRKGERQAPETRRQDCLTSTVFRAKLRSYYGLPCRGNERMGNQQGNKVHRC